MKQGTLYIQDRGREAKVKGAGMIVLLAGLWAATLLPRFDIAVLVVLALWAVVSVVLDKKAQKGNWYHKDAPWTLTDDTLTVDGLSISRAAIKRTMCIPKPGFQRKSFRGWVLKVETQDKTYEWFSYYQADKQQQKSVDSLQALAMELGTDWQPWINA